MHKPSTIVRLLPWLLFLFQALVAPIGHAQVSKGFQILIDRGFQAQGLAATSDAFHLSTYTNANYNSLIWLWDSNPSLMGAAPGFPWSRWAGNEASVPPQGGEGPYMSQLVTLQLGDEWELNNDELRQRSVDWFNAIRGNFPNTILYMNNYGGQVNDASLGDFIVRAQPDMLSFDTYPFRPPGASYQLVNWYGDCRRYRQHALQNNIPLSVYMQTYYSVSEGVRSPSASELRLNHSVAMAFNAKVLIDFTYNTGASSLFNNASGGDNSPNALYYEKADVNKRARNLGKALVRLRPVTDAVANSYTTGIMFIRGRDSSGTTPNPIPIGFLADPSSPNNYTDWEYQRNDPYLNGWEVTNVGTKNNGQDGDVIISWFKVLDESFDGAYANEIYMMVVNGLSDPTGTAADCAQEIKLNFLNSFSAVEMLDPVTGQAQVQTLPVVSSKRQLVLNLNGGDAALFKFSDGAPFVGVGQVSTAPGITSQPASRTNTAGTTATFNVTATGAAPLTYRWRKNGVTLSNSGNISGSTNSTLSLSNVQSSDSGSYTVVVSNVSGTITSSTATLTIQSIIVDTNIIDASTLNGKFMMGYQAWHAAQGDGSSLNKYIHWSHSDQPPSTTDMVDDIWPDLSEFDADELFAAGAGLNLGNGQPAKVYSAYKSKTVNRHFKWMRDYGIDGVMLQRFIKDVMIDASWAALRNTNLVNVRAAAEAYGRVFCVEYDMSNDDPAQVISHLQTDWAYLTGTLGITNSSRYLKHRGKPLVGVWGLGFSGVNVTPAEAQTIINNFKAAGCTVMGGVPYNWRFLNGDSHTNAAWADVYKSYDVINPWSVGRYTTTNQVDGLKTSVLAGDLSYCQANGMDYMPVIFPGYSAANLNSGTKNGIARFGGRFYWRQAYNAISTGCNMMFGAMFDEVDEGTALYKLAPTLTTSPVYNNIFALDVDGESLPSDWYLRVTTEITKALRGEVPLSEPLPITPTAGIKLLAPVGGETWVAGQNVNVTWSTTGAVSSVNIDLSTDAGFTWSRLAYGVTNTGSRWLSAPAVTSAACRVRVSGIDGTPADAAKTNFTITATNPNYSAHLDPLWSLAPGSRSYVTTDISSAPNQRSIAYNALSNQVYIVSRTGATTGLSVNVLDAASGGHLYQLNTTGISGGSIVLLGIAVAEDGAIYAGNMHTSGSTGVASYKLYRWANSNPNTVPVRVFSAEPAGRTDPVRWGDTLAVRGSGTNTQVVIDAMGTNLCAVLTPNDSTMNSWRSTGGLQDYYGGKIGRSLQFGTSNTFWQKRKADRLQKASYNLDLASSSLTVATVTNYNFLPSSVGPVAIDFQRNLLAALNFSGTGNAPDTVDLYNISNLGNPTLLAKYNFPINQQGNANFIGQVICAGDKVFAIDGNNGVLAFSIVAQIDPPLILSQPQGSTNAIDSSANFSVGLSGTAPFGFQWHKNGSPISTATNSFLALPNVQAGDAASYSVVVSNPAGSTTSSNAVLVVIAPPGIVTPPQNCETGRGTNATFTVEVSGSSPFSFRWKKNGSLLNDSGNISGASSATLTVIGTQSSDAASYSVLVTNNIGAAESSSAVLSVIDAPIILTQPAAQTINVGTTATFHVSASGQSLTYQWRKDATNMVNGGNVSGANGATLTLSSVTRNDTANYSIVVTNVAGVVTSSTAGLVVNYPFPYHEPFNYSIGVNLGGQTNPNGLLWSDVGTATAGPYITITSGNLSVAGLDSSSGNSILFGGLGKSARFSFAAGNPVTAGTLYYSFALKVTDTNGIGTGGFITGFNNSTGTQTGQPTVVGTRVYLRGTSGGFNIGLSKNSSTTTDWVWDPRIFTNNQTIFLVGSYLFNSASSTDDISKLWINPASSDFGAGTPPPAALTNAAGSDLTANQIGSFVFFQRSSTAEPAAMIADELRMGTAWAQVTPSLLAPPVITTQPRSLVVNPGAAATFNVVASGSALGFQWRFNGTNILDATASSFTRNNAQLVDVGSYSVVLSNAAGSIISSNATLTVAPSSAVTINGDKVLVIDGRKVFPITLSPGPPTNGKTPTGKDGLQEFREAGALFVRMAQTSDWNSQLILDQHDLLNWAYQNGMYCLLNLRELSYFPAGNTTTEPALRSLMNQFKNHPALGMWKNKDEAWWGGVSAADLQRGYDVIRHEDPFHPVEQTHAPRGTVADLQPYNAAADILAVDIYPVVASGSASNPPITNTLVSQVGDWTRALSEVANGEKSFWMIEQIAFSGTAPPAHTLVFPTFHQSRFMAYQAIINGARGLMFFGGNVAATLNAQDAPLGWNWTFWNDVLKPVVQELGDNSLLSNALVAPVSTLPITMSGTTDPDVEFCVREVPPYIYILASKREGATTNVTFSGLPVSAAIGDVLYESSRTVTAYNGQFTDSFAPLDVHVYRFHATNQVPAITAQPQSRTNILGTTATFTATADGSGPLVYRWRKNGSALSDGGNITGANSPTLTFSPVTLNDAANYSVLVTNLAGSATSANATLTVQVAPSILTQPQSQTVNVRTNVSFFVTANGSAPLTFQWMFGGKTISGATSSALNFLGVQLTNAGTYSVMVSNTAGVVWSSNAFLTVTQRVISFVAVAGAYNGLFFEADEVRHHSSGFLNTTIRTNGGFSGKLLLDGNTISISGKFGIDGITNRVISRARLGKPDVVVNLEINPSTDQLRGTVSSVGWTSGFLADRAIFSKTNLATNLFGKYTMLLPGSINPTVAPAGFGHGFITVITNGRISSRILLSDNALFSQSVPIGTNGQWPFFGQIYRGVSVATNPLTSLLVTNKDYKGSLLGWLTITNTTSRRLLGDVNWTKTRWTNAIYASGFTNEIEILGSPYTAPLKGTRVLNLTNATLLFSEGNLNSRLTNRISLRTNNTFTVISSNGTFKITVTTSTGSMQGSFHHPHFGTNKTFKGAMLQQQKTAGGFFLGTNQSGTVLLAP